MAQIPSEMRPARKKVRTLAAAAQEQGGVAPQLSKEDLETFFDGFMPIQLEEKDVAGAVISVVKDGRVLFEKGYGYADMKARKPVTVDTTLFRPGSISKTFMWTAIMQLYEQGKIDLNADVNQYIDFHIPARFGKPITVKDLMTHTPGFQEQIKDLFVENATDLRPLNVYLENHVPRQIFPPGTTPAYSNYGAAVGGYIVQRVSGMPFNEYIEKNIFQPLGMNHTTFRQPLPPNLQPLMSNGYDKASGEPKRFEFVQAWPAGSVSTTADDMTHWMLAHLGNGEYNGVRILKPETAELMHSRAFINMPELNAGCYGFYEQSRNGHRSIGHGGDTQWFHSDMFLLLDDHVGLFVSFNSAGKGSVSLRDALWNKFLDRYFPYTPPAAKRVASSAGDIKSVAGTYWNSRRSQTDLVAVGSLFGQAKVTANSDGTISVSGFADFAGDPKHYEEVAPMVFREVHGQDQIGFKKDWSGQIFAIDFPFMVFQRTPLLKNGTLNQAVLVFAMVVFVLTLVFWPVGAILRRHYNQHLGLARQHRALRLLIRIVCIINVAFMALFVAWISSIGTNLAALSERYDARLHALQVLGLIGLIGSIFCIYYLVYSWAADSVWFWTRVWNTLLTCACLGYVFFVLNWHMLNFHLNY